MADVIVKARHVWSSNSPRLDWPLLLPPVCVKLPLTGNVVARVYLRQRLFNCVMEKL